MVPVASDVMVQVFPPKESPGPNMHQLALHVAEHVGHHFQGGLGRIVILPPPVDPLKKVARHVVSLVTHPVQDGLDVGSRHVC